MLGFEYTWLVSSTRAPNGDLQIRMAGSGMTTLAVAIFFLLAVVLNAEPPHHGLLRDATAAREAGDTRLFIEKLEAARDLRPDYPRILNNLARAYVAAGRTDDALQQLGELAAMGLWFNLAADKALAPLHDREDFKSLAQRFERNKTAVIGASPSETTIRLSGIDGILEGVATNPTTGEMFFGDVRNHCIWARPTNAEPGAPLVIFSQGSDALSGVFAVKIDAAKNKLWAACSALPEMKDFTAADKGRAFLAEYDLNTRTLARRYDIPADGAEHVLGDFIIARDGTIYVTDSTAPILWRLAPGSTQLEKWLEHPEFVSLQGIALSTDGRTLHIADYANGLWRVAIATKAATRARAPAQTTLFGIDGIYSTRNGDLIAVQNGVAPQRILRLSLNAAGEPVRCEVIRAGHPDMTDVTLGQIVNDRFEFIANAGWNLFPDTKSNPPARDVTILSTQL